MKMVKCRKLISSLPAKLEVCSLFLKFTSDVTYPSHFIKLLIVFFQEGVGDTPDSFAYDGHRVRKWNMSTAKYGEVITELKMLNSNSVCELAVP